MAVRIQFRRGTASEWSTSNPVLASGELGYESDSKIIKFGDGTSTWSTLPVAAAGDITAVTAGTGLTGGGTSGAVTLNLDTSVVLTAASIDNKGDLLIGTADNTYAKQAVGANGTSLVADSAQSTGVTWSQIIPTGTILPYAGTTAPSGFLMCFGQQVTVAAGYSALVTVLGSAYGGDGINNANVPDLRGRVIAGKDDMGGTSASRLNNFASTTLGTTMGLQDHKIASTEMPAHSHGMNSHTHSMSDHRHAIGHGHADTISFSDTGHSHPESGRSTNASAPGYLQRIGTSGPNYDFTSASTTRFDAVTNPATASGNASLSKSGSVTDAPSSVRSGAPVDSGGSSNPNTGGPSTANTVVVGGNGVNDNSSHNNVQPTLILNYIIKT